MKFTNSFIYRKTALTLAFVLFFQALLPVGVYALTSGPSTPEVQSFEPVGTSEMVDLFSGDFNYNIPLLEVGGYPINIAYHAGIGMESEASWVGLGWNLNPGSINRNMRGIPDDFSGEVVKKTVHIKDNISASLLAAPDVEVIGAGVDLGFTVGVKYDNYRGFDIAANANLGMDISLMGASSLNLDMGIDLEDGYSFKPSLSFNRNIKNKEGTFQFSGGLNIGAQYNSRTGLSEISFSRAYSTGVAESAAISHEGLQMSYLQDRSFGVSNTVSGSLFTFNTPSYTTHSDYNKSNSSFSLDIRIGPEIPFTGFSGSMLGSYNKMSVQANNNRRAYGYQNYHLANPKADLLDFNREKEGPFYFSSGRLPLTNLTYDTYSIVGQGVGGIVRPYRNSVGLVSDPVTFSTDEGDNIGFDLGLIASPFTFKGGGNYATNEMSSYSGIWTEDNEAISKFSYAKESGQLTNTVDDLLYENYYFKNIGENSLDRNRYKNLKEEAPIRPNVDDNEVFDNFIMEQQNNLVTVDIDPITKERARRNHPLSALSASETTIVGLGKQVENFNEDFEIEGSGLKKEITDISARVESEDIGENQLYELISTKADGMRYVYGLPVYNKSQLSATFSIGENQKEIKEGTINEYSGNANYSANNLTSANEYGIDGFVSKEEIPSYAYAHKLTAVLSADYIDYTGDGPTDDDFGTWVKFNYTNLTKDDYYNWKFPYLSSFVSETQTGKAGFSEGFKTYTKDDKGNFISGEKELWILHSIESKNHIAIFETEDREDGFGLDNFGNAISTSSNGFVSQKKLSKIKHYSKHDFFNNVHPTSNTTTATPLKTVHFEYNYSLCEGVPNNIKLATNDKGNGKLTLEKLWFTYGNTTKGMYSKYQFHYPLPNTVENPNYNRKAQDRWGNYKREGDGSSLPNYNPKFIGNNSPLSNSDYPYAEQDEGLADTYAKAWNMNKIELPSGGIIDIEYEADDYAYVQDRQAGQMFKLEGIYDNIPNAVGSNVLYSGNAHRKYLTVKIDNSIQTDEEFEEKYLKGIRRLYFRCLSELVHGKYEFVPGYAKIEDSGIFEVDSERYGYIKIAGVSEDDDDDAGELNPITKASLNFTRLNLPNLIWPEKDPDNDTAETLILSLFTLLVKEPGRMINGLNNSLISDGFSRRVKLDKSFIRLNNPTYRKKGGGHRVKKISMTDNWSSLADGEDASYGHQYFYTTTKTNDSGEEIEISSGVSTYEPALGNDENSLKQPIGVKEERFLAPDNNHYIETPIGESFYPAASVGYSEITVAATRPSNDISRTATGYTKSKFYTAKDYPIKTLESFDPDPYRNTPSVLESLFDYKSEDYASGSNGYSIILNDMHGKPKETWTYSGALPVVNDELVYDVTNEVGSEISGQIYRYRIDEDGNFNNEVPVIDDKGIVSDKIIGIESEVALDYREHSTEVTRLDVEGNVDAWFIPPFFGLAAISAWPDYKEQITRFRGAVATKVVNKHGLVDRVEVHSNGSIVTTKNELYDAVTGDVLVTSVNNEFKDKNENNESNLIYNTSYPAHWVYDGMKPAVTNQGGQFILVPEMSGEPQLVISDNQTQPISVNHHEIFEAGDELLLDNIFAAQQDRVWVSEVNDNNIVIINTEGDIYDISQIGLAIATAKIVRSGHRNQQSLPIASLTSLENPIGKIFGTEANPIPTTPNGNSTANLEQQASDLKVLNFSAQEYDDLWETYCKDGATNQSQRCLFIPKLIHPDTEIENKFRKELIEVSNFWKFEYLEVMEGTFNCEEFGTEELVTMERNIGRMFIDGDAIEDGFYIDKLYLKKDDGNGNLSNIEVPLSNIVYNAPNLDDYKSNLELEINNYLLSNYTSSEFNPFFVSFANGTSGLQIYSFVKHKPDHTFIGLKKNDSYYKYYDPISENFANSPTPKFRGFIHEVNGELTLNECQVVSYSSDIFGPFDSSTDFNFAIFNTNDDILNLDFSAPSIVCYVDVPIPCLAYNETVNPFQEGLRGNWRPSKSYVHNNVPRVQPEVDLAVTNQTNLANNGYYEYFDQFWNKPTTSEDYWSKDEENYTLVSEVTKYNPYGEALESKDALGNYSSAILGYDNKLAVAVGQNIAYQDFGYDGFEEHTYFANIDPCRSNLHLDLVTDDSDVSDLYAHTGFYSLEVQNNETVILKTECQGPQLRSSGSNGGDGEYNIDLCDDCLPKYRPAYNTEEGANNKHIVDLWLHGEGTVTINQLGEGQLLASNTYEAQGPVIEGWQRVYDEFTLHEFTSNLRITFESTNGTMYVDDVRFYPFDGVMKSFVYHPSSLKLVAELDENNHATFYEYDEEWNLVRVKKETEKGIYTLQENRSNVRMEVE